MPNFTKLLIAHDECLYRDCLASALLSAERFHVKSTDVSKSALTELRQHLPKVMLVGLDGSRTRALTLVSLVAREFPDVKVVIVGVAEDNGEILECVEAGAAAYMLKGQSIDSLLAVIDAVVRGESPCSPAVAQRVFSRLSFLARQRPKTDDTSSVLSSRETEIVRMIAEGYSNKQIARKLCRSLHTVKNHVHRIIEKLGVTTRAEAARLSLDRGWLIGSLSSSVHAAQGQAVIRLPAG